jgi:hypothetical protein
MLIGEFQHVCQPISISNHDGRVLIGTYDGLHHTHRLDEELDYIRPSSQAVHHDPKVI